MGAVMVVTDTSGARDDVKEGVNGYVVDIANIDSMVEKIEYLYYHRDLLPVMGKQSSEIIIERNQLMDVKSFWKSILN